MCADMHGPMTYRHSDLDLLAGSKLNERLKSLQMGEPMQFVGYGDGIFPIQSHCIGKHVGNLSVEEIEENRAMAKMRIANEWAYGITGRYFPFVKNCYRLKMLKDLLATKYYFVATLMRNIQVCLYGCQTNSYYYMKAPTLEEYFGTEE